MRQKLRQSIPLLVMTILSVLNLKAETGRILPELEISPSSETIEIDGNLNDPGWQKAGIISEMYVASKLDGKKNEQAKVRITYDNDNIYIACKVTHPDPQKNTVSVGVYGIGTAWVDAMQIEKGETPTGFEP